MTFCFNWSRLDETAAEAIRLIINGKLQSILAERLAGSAADTSFGSQTRGVATATAANNSSTNATAQATPSKNAANTAIAATTMRAAMTPLTPRSAAAPPALGLAMHASGDTVSGLCADSNASVAGSGEFGSATISSIAGKRPGPSTTVTTAAATAMSLPCAAPTTAAAGAAGGSANMDPSGSGNSSKPLLEYFRVSSLEWGAAPPFVELVNFTDAVVFSEPEHTARATAAATSTCTPSMVGAPASSLAGVGATTLSPTNQSSSSAPAWFFPSSREAPFMQRTPRGTALTVGGNGEIPRPALGGDASTAVAGVTGGTTPAGIAGHPVGRNNNNSSSSNANRGTTEARGLRTGLSTFSPSCAPHQLAIDAETISGNAPGDGGGGSGGRGTDAAAAVIGDSSGMGAPTPVASSALQPPLHAEVDTLAPYLGPGGLFVRLHVTYGGSLRFSLAAAVQYDLHVLGPCITLPLRMPLTVHVSDLDLDCYVCGNLHRNMCRLWLEPGKLSASPINRANVVATFGERRGVGGGFGGSHSSNNNNNSTGYTRAANSGDGGGLGPGGSGSYGGGGGDFDFECDSSVDYFSRLGSSCSDDGEDDAVFVDERQVELFLLRELKALLQDRLMLPHYVTIPVTLGGVS